MYKVQIYKTNISWIYSYNFVTVYFINFLTDTILWAWILNAFRFRIIFISACYAAFSKQMLSLSLYLKRVHYSAPKGCGERGLFAVNVSAAVEFPRKSKEGAIKSAHSETKSGTRVSATRTRKRQSAKVLQAVEQVKTRNSCAFLDDKRSRRTQSN